MWLKATQQYFLVTGALNSGYVPEDARSHISQFSTRSRSRSEHGLFGQSQRYPSRNGESTHTLSEYLGPRETFASHRVRAEEWGVAGRCSEH